MTDGSDTGWGVHSPIMQTYGFWAKEEAQMSINVRELQSILFALKLHAERFRNSTIKVLMDNKISIKYMAKAGGMASIHLQNIAVQIQNVCNSYNLQVIYQHIKGINNVEADRLSRIKKPLYESTIPRTFFQTIMDRWGPLTIDMFATRHIGS
jgi:ribonuclease HI